jgi:hypothetical protein
MLYMARQLLATPTGDAIEVIVSVIPPKRLSSWPVVLPSYLSRRQDRPLTLAVQSHMALTRAHHGCIF